MLYKTLADAVVLVHLAFVIFVVLGAVLVLRWPRLAWVHLPAAVWGALVEIGGWICPLTPLENRLRSAAGESGYSGGFIDHYVMPVLYPAELTRGVQLALAAVVIAINLGLYGVVLRRRARGK